MSRDRIVELDKRHVWHPYTQMSEYAGVDPLVLAGAEGVHLIDANGRRYLDGNSQWWVATLGHGHPRIRAALAKQLESFAHVSLAGVIHEPAARLAEELVAVAPKGLTRVLFSDDGSTAVEAALELALHFFAQNGEPHRSRFVVLHDGFHGETLGAKSLGAVDEFRHPYAAVLFDCARTPNPDLVGWPAAFEWIESLLAREGETIAAVVVEPVLQGAAGMRIYPPALLTRLREWTRTAGALLVCDEVLTGYGRTSAMWASDLAAVTPDLLCTAKGFTAGTLPMAATLATERIFEGFLGEKSRAFFHGHSFAGNPLGAAVAREVLAIYRDEDVLGQVAAKAPIVRAAFEQIGRISGVNKTRTIGLVGAADLGTGGYLGPTGWKVYEAALRRGAYLRPIGDTVYVCPALTIPEPDLRRLLEILADSVAEVLRG
jgi:adenosylmethionine-8-amino-7-oxononanoate aminotransferase